MPENSTAEKTWLTKLKDWKTFLAIIAIILGIYVSTNKILDSFFVNKIIWHGEIYNNSKVKLSPTNPNIKVEFINIIFPEELASSSIYYISAPDFSFSLDSLEIQIVKNLVKPEFGDTLGKPYMKLNKDIFDINGLPVGIESQFILDGQQYTDRSLYWLRLQMQPRVELGKPVNGYLRWKLERMEISSVNFIFLNNLSLKKTKKAVEEKWRKTKGLDS